MEELKWSFSAGPLSSFTIMSFSVVQCLKMSYNVLHCLSLSYNALHSLPVFLKCLTVSSTASIWGGWNGRAEMIQCLLRSLRGPCWEISIGGRRLGEADWKQNQGRNNGILEMGVCTVFFRRTFPKILSLKVANSSNLAVINLEIHEKIKKGAHHKKQQPCLMWLFFKMTRAWQNNRCPGRSWFCLNAAVHCLTIRSTPKHAKMIFSKTCLTNCESQYDILQNMPENMIHSKTLSGDMIQSKTCQNDPLHGIASHIVSHNMIHSKTHSDNMIDSKACNDLGREALVVVSIPDIGMVVLVGIVVIVGGYTCCGEAAKETENYDWKQTRGPENVFQCLSMQCLCFYNVFFAMSNNVLVLQCITLTISFTERGVPLSPPWVMLIDSDWWWLQLMQQFNATSIIQGVFFLHWYPPKKLKYGKPRLGESTLT